MNVVEKMKSQFSTIFDEDLNTEDTKILLKKYFKLYKNSVLDTANFSVVNDISKPENKTKLKDLEKTVELNSLKLILIFKIFQEEFVKST